MGNCSSIKNPNRNIRSQTNDISHNEMGKENFKKVLK